MDNLPNNIIKTVSYECTSCHARIHMGEYEDPNRINQTLDEWIARHKPDHRDSY